MVKKRVNITITEETRSRLLQYGVENNIPGGLSGVLEYIAWHAIKVKGNVLKGQVRMDGE